MPDDFVDLTELQKRGIPIRRSPPEPQTESGYVDLPQPSSQAANPLAFLDSLAGSSSPTPPAPTPDTQDLKVQIENFEYKLDRLTEKLAMIESKLATFEEKL